MCDAQPKFLSTVEAATVMGVGESSVKRWIDGGTLTATKTPGGHRRIAVPDLYRFLIATGQQLADPSVVGLGEGELGDAEAFRISCKESIAQGDMHGLESVLRAMRISGMSPITIFDDVVYPAFLQVRASCEHPSQECRVLHRALIVIQTAVRAAMAPMNSQTTPMATRIVYADIGYDVDAVPTFLAEASTWDLATGQQLGAGVPRQVIEGALEPFRAGILWLSASGPARDRLADDWRSISARAASLKIRVVAYGDQAAKVALEGQCVVSSFAEFRNQVAATLQRGGF